MNKEKIKEYISQKCKLSSDYKNIEIRDSWDFSKDFLKFIKMIDIEFYKSIVKKCYDEKLYEEETKIRVEKMNAIKELNKENKEGNK